MSIIIYIKFSILKQINEKFEIETTLKDFSYSLQHCSTILHVTKMPPNIAKKRMTRSEVASTQIGILVIPFSNEIPNNGRRPLM